MTSTCGVAMGNKIRNYQSTHLILGSNEPLFLYSKLLWTRTGSRRELLTLWHKRLHTTTTQIRPSLISRISECIAHPWLLGDIDICHYLEHLGLPGQVEVISHRGGGLTLTNCFFGLLSTRLLLNTVVGSPLATPQEKEHTNPAMASLSLFSC